MNIKNIIFFLFFLILCPNISKGNIPQSPNSDWVNLKNDEIDFRFNQNILESIVLEIKLKDLKDKPQPLSFENFNVVFFNDQMDIAQFNCFKVAKDDNGFVHFFLNGNTDFFLNNLISKILINFSDNSIKIIPNQNTRNLIVERYKRTLKFEKHNNLLNRISVAYDIMFQNSKIFDLGPINGFELQYLHFFNIATFPLFLESGLGFNFNYKKPESEKLSRPFQRFSISIPVNISYIIDIKKNISFQPYAGINIKYNYMKGYYSWSTYKIKHKLLCLNGTIALSCNISRFNIGLNYDFEIVKLHTVSSCTTAPKLSDLMIRFGYNF